MLHLLPSGPHFLTSYRTIVLINPPKNTPAPNTGTSTRTQVRPSRLCLRRCRPYGARLWVGCLRDLQSAGAGWRPWAVRCVYFFLIAAPDLSPGPSSEKFMLVGVRSIVYNGLLRGLVTPCPHSFFPRVLGLALRWAGNWHRLCARNSCCMHYTSIHPFSPLTLLTSRIVPRHYVG